MTKIMKTTILLLLVTGIVWMAVIRAADAAKKRCFESHAQQFTDRFSAVE